jgi:tRNA (Thr-GGU) A37 N-methylase
MYQVSILFSNTLVLDIKPYLPSVDYIKSRQNEMIEKEHELITKILLRLHLFY